MRQPGEASVEEILESIKKVIARDSRELAVEARREREHVEPAVPIDAPVDVLDLAMSAQFLDDDDGDDDAIEPAVVIEESLITAESRAAMRQSLAALAVMSEPPAHPQIVRTGETSLEELTRELLRPALAEWLDKHLPPMVEQMVAAEIARIVGKKG